MALMPISNWAVNPVILQTNYRYRSTDTPDMPADPLNGGGKGEGGESTGEILPATGSVRRNILIILTLFT